MSAKPWLFTSETARAARAKVRRVRVFDRKAWARDYQKMLRQRRRQHGVCLRCGFELVEVYAKCNKCRRLASLERRRKRAEVETVRA